MGKIWLSFFVGLMMVVLAACGGQAETQQSSEPADQSIQEERDMEMIEDDFEAFKKQRKENYQTQ